MIISRVIALLLLCAAGAAQALGPEGHALVAGMAEANLQPAVRSEVRRLLSLEPDHPPTLDWISSWADDWREKNKETGPFHFVDIPLAASSYDEQRDCHYDKDMQRVAETTCVISKISEFLRVLADPTRSDADRLIALKYLVHLVGDIHQPFHAVDNMDKGGNGIGLTYFGQPTNLHAVWDGGIIEKQYGWSLGPNYSFDHTAVSAAARQLDGEITVEQRVSWRLQSADLAASLAVWANESHQLAALAYMGVPAVKWPGWETQYQTAFWPYTRTQLQKASVRLASLLNLAFKAADQCPSAENFPAFYVGPRGGPEDKLSPANFAQDFYCAALFKSSRFPRGFVGVYGSAAIRKDVKFPDPEIDAANRALYEGVYNFALNWSKKYGSTYPILTGGGPGLMQAANEGAMEAKAPSVGYTTYYDPDFRKAFPIVNGKPVVTEGLIFSSDAARESSMLSHSAAIVVAPGGSGTGWEIFQALDTLRNKQLSPVPMLLVGANSHWYGFCDFIDDMNARGTLGRDKFDAVVTRVESLSDVEAVLAYKLGLRADAPAGMSSCVASPKKP